MNKVQKWISEHKKSIAIGSLSVFGIITIAAIITHPEEAKEMLASLELLTGKASDLSERSLSTALIPEKTESVLLNTAPRTHSYLNSEPFEVCGHVRSLPEGRHASSEAIAKAVSKGIELLPNQTYVQDYMKLI